MVPSERGFARELEGSTHLLEVTKERGAGVRGDKKAEANTKEDVFLKASASETESVASSSTIWENPVRLHMAAGTCLEPL